MAKILFLSSFLAINMAFGTVLDPTWTFFKLTHEKNYAPHREDSLRYSIFKDRVDTIQRHNERFRKGLESFEMEINKFTDMTYHEFAEIYLSPIKLKAENSLLLDEFTENEAVYEEGLAALDWRRVGAVTPVKDQANCGSCWAFSATGSLEGQIFRKKGILLSLSEQQLVDCSRDNQGCNGGLMNFAFEYVAKNGGIETEDDYEYVGSEGVCGFNSSKVAATCEGYVDLPSGSENVLKKALTDVGPISIAIDVAGIEFMHYKSGVFVDNKCDPNALNHGVLLVGYGTQKSFLRSRDYWLVKNSWSENWGEKGYIRIARNQGNMCGIASMASYPVV